MADEERTEDDEKSGKVYDQDDDDAGGDEAEKGSDSGDENGDGEDWEAKAKQARTAANRERKARERLAAKLKAAEDENKSESEKALEQAREEARKEALAEADKDRRADRLEVAVTRIAAKGVTLSDGDERKTVRFADAEDALDKVNRRIRDGEIDDGEIFDSEGKVDTTALAEALADVAGDYPHLIGEGGTRARPKGDADARKGSPGEKDLEAMTPEDHARRKYPANK